MTDRTEQPNERITLASRPKRFRLDSSHRVVEPSSTLDVLNESALLTSVVRDTSLYEDDALGVPVFTLESAIVSGSPRTDRIMGKGITRDQALCSGYMEALERYSCSASMYRRSATIGTPGRTSLTVDTLTRIAVDAPPEMSSKRPSFTASTKYSNVTRSRLEPETYCVARLKSPRASGITVSTEVVDRIQSEQKFSFRLKLLTLDIPVPVFGCIAFDHEEEQPFVGYGCHLDPEIGLARAITEMIQARVLFENTASDLVGRRRHDPANMPEFHYLWNEAGSSIPLEKIENLSSDDLLDDLHTLLDMMRTKDLEIIVVNGQQQAGGILVVRVLVPGTQCVDWVWLFGDESLGQGNDRVLRVPEELGIEDAPRSLEELDLKQITFR